MAFLDFDGGFEGSGDEGVGEVAHPEGWHEVLEHGAGPGEEGCAAIDDDVGAVEAEPGLLWNVSLGDGEESCDAGFGGEEVVAGGVDFVGGGVVTDGEELAGFYEEELVVHGVGVELGQMGDFSEV